MAELLKQDTFKSKVLEQKGLVLVDFFADWCVPCKMMAPVVDEIAEQYNNAVKVYKLNTEENMELVMEYKTVSIPALILFKDGQVAERTVGLIDKTEIEAMLRKYI